jgi:hypothetical protein
MQRRRAADEAVTDEGADEPRGREESAIADTEGTVPPSLQQYRTQGHQT